jgi:hypothetical protein
MMVEFSGHCFVLTHSQNEMLNSHNIQETNVSPSWGLECDLFSPYPGEKKGKCHNSYILQIICQKLKIRLRIGYKSDTASMYGIKNIVHL